MGGHNWKTEGYGLPQDLQGHCVWLLDRIMGWVSLVAHGGWALLVGFVWEMGSMLRGSPSRSMSRRDALHPTAPLVELELLRGSHFGLVTQTSICFDILNSKQACETPCGGTFRSLPGRAAQYYHKQCCPERRPSCRRVATARIGAPLQSRTLADITIRAGECDDAGGKKHFA